MASLTEKYKDILYHKVPDKPIPDLSIVNTEMIAYFLGYMYADGCITYQDKAHKNLSFGCKLSIKDLKIMNLFASFLNINVYANETYLKEYNKTYEFVCLKTTNKVLINQLIEKGIFPTKSYTDRSSFSFDIIPENLKNHYIRGFVDGDGWFSKYKNTKGKAETIDFGICGINNIILEVINNYITSKLNIIKHDIMKYKHEDCHRLKYSKKDDVRKIRNYLYKNATIFLQRKFDIVKDL